MWIDDIEIQQIIRGGFLERIYKELPRRLQLLQYSRLQKMKYDYPFLDKLMINIIENKKEVDYLEGCGEYLFSLLLFKLFVVAEHCSDRHGCIFFRKPKQGGGGKDTNEES